MPFSSRLPYITTLKLDHHNVEIQFFKHPKIEIYLLGTNHLAELSVEAVHILISRVKPHVVGTELCLRRLEMANDLSDAVGIRDQYQQLVRIPKRRRRKAAIELQRVRLACQALEYVRRDKREYVNENKRGYRVRPIIIEDLAIGGDMFAPFQNLTWRLESREPTVLVNAFKQYKILLIDRPLEETYLRVASALTDRELEIINHYKDDFINLFLQSEPAAAGIMMNIWRTNRKLMKIEMKERDKYLAWSLLRALDVPVKDTKTIRPRPTEPVRIVGLVGQRHVPGIMQILRSNKTVERLNSYQ